MTTPSDGMMGTGVVGTAAPTWCKLCTHEFPAGSIRWDFDRHAVETHGMPDSSDLLTAWGPARQAMARHLTDTGNAERLIDRHGSDLLFVNGEWYVWDGKRFRKDATGEIHRRARETGRAIYVEASIAPDTAERKATADWAKRTEARERQHSMIKLAESDSRVARRIEELDADSLLLTVNNGTLDLKSGTLRPHERSDLITKLAPVSFDPDATAPAFTAFLDRVLPDAEVREYLQRYIGYGLTASAEEERMLMLEGSGANGKSTLIEILRKLLGDYAVSSKSEILLSNRDTGGGESIARLAGARIVFVDESAAGRRLDAEKLKTLTSPGTRQARHLYRNSFEFQVTHKLIFATNHRPDLDADDEGAWRRTDVMPFSVTIPENERDPRLRAKLERELPGIMNWALVGCLRWQQVGLKPPTQLRAAAKEYREENDAIGRFLAECTEPKGAAPAGRLYHAYVNWCEANSERPLTQTSFGRAMKKRPGLACERTGKVRLYVGVRLPGDAEVTG